MNGVEIYGTATLSTEKPRNECTLGPTTVAGPISLIPLLLFQVDDKKLHFPLRIPLMKLVSSKVFIISKKHGSTKENLDILDPRTLEKPLGSDTAKASSKRHF
nr:CIH_HP1_G0040690.mRNA.1.CDS.1 [Saccharomyces cerevisiae]